MLHSQQYSTQRQVHMLLCSVRICSLDWYVCCSFFWGSLGTNEEICVLGNTLESKGPVLLIWRSDGSHDTISQGRGQLVCETQALDSHLAHGLVGASHPKYLSTKPYLGVKIAIASSVALFDTTPFFLRRVSNQDQQHSRRSFEINQCLRTLLTSF